MALLALALLSLYKLLEADKRLQNNERIVIIIHMKDMEGDI